MESSSRGWTYLPPSSGRHVPGGSSSRGRILERTYEIVVVEAPLADEDVIVATATATILIVSIETPGLDRRGAA
jgi:hypothetical protein